MGQLFYVIGASGVGKDTLLTYAREKIDGKLPILFAHRYITRPAYAGGENHVSLSHHEFEQRRQNGLFVMNWESHGNCYGIGREIDFWLSQQCAVVVNGSREYQPEALKRYPWITTVLIDARPDLIRERLSNRKRETKDEIIERIARNAALEFPASASVVTLQNNGALADAGDEFVRILMAGIFAESGE